jgi:hypothetical protein
MTTFRAWLTIARVTNDPEGDFVADARRDPTFPEAVPDIKAMRGYLLRQGACREALAGRSRQSGCCWNASGTRTILSLWNQPKNARTTSNQSLRG